MNDIYKALENVSKAYKNNEPLCNYIDEIEKIIQPHSHTICPPYECKMGFKLIKAYNSHKDILSNIDE